MQNFVGQSGMKCGKGSPLHSRRGGVFRCIKNCHCTAVFVNWANHWVVVHWLALYKCCTCGAVFSSSSTEWSLIPKSPFTPDLGWALVAMAVLIVWRIYLFHMIIPNKWHTSRSTTCILLTFSESKLSPVCNNIVTLWWCCKGNSFIDPHIALTLATRHNMLEGCVPAGTAFLLTLWIKGF